MAGVKVIKRLSKGFSDHMTGLIKIKLVGSYLKKKASESER